MPANHVITITGVNSDDTLDLSDHGNTVTKPEDTVTWIIGQGSGVNSITDIVKKPGFPDVFNPDPAPVGSSKNWKGTIDGNIASFTEEEYTIEYTKVPGGQVFSYDPKIQVNP